MPGLETSMYHVATPEAPASPLDMMSKAAGIQNALNQNQLFQQTNRARISLGHIMQQSVDPQSGQIDYDKAAVSLSQHPDTALIAPDIIGKWAQQKNLQLDNVHKQLENAKARDDHLFDIASAVALKGAQGQSYYDSKGIGQPDAIDQKDLFRAIGQLDPNHRIPDDVKLKWAAGIGRPAGQDGQPNYGGPYDPKKAYQDVFQFALAKKGAAENVNSVQQRLPSVGASGQPISQPAGSVPGALGVGQGGPAGAGGGSPIPGPSGALPTGLNPLAHEVLTKYAPALADRATQAGLLHQNLAEMRSLLSEFTPGAATPAAAKIGALMASLGAPESMVKRISQGDLGAIQAFDKLSVQGGTQLMSQVFPHGAGRAALEWNRFQQAFPNLATSKSGAERMFDYMDRIGTLTQHEKEFFDKWRGAGKPVDEFQGWWSKQIDKNLESYWKAQTNDKAKLKMILGHAPREE